jgi:GT2 family glycosyltransferase
MPDISIIVVTWNAQRYVRECLDSLMHATAGLSAEIIAVDNASTDGTPQVINQQFPRVTLISNAENMGFAKANNVGLRLSSGDFIFLINSDVNVPPDCLKRMVGYMEQHANIGLLGPRMLGPEGKTARSCMRFPTLWNSFCRALALDSFFARSRLFGGSLMRDFAHDRMAEVEVLNGWFWLVRREALVQVGLLDERFFIYGEDIDWCQRFHQSGWRVVFYPEAEALHYGGASSANAPIRFCIEMQCASLQYWKKHHGRFSSACYVLISLLNHALRIAGYVAAYTVSKSARSQAEFKIRRSAACLRWLAASQIS